MDSKVVLVPRSPLSAPAPWGPIGKPCSYPHRGGARAPPHCGGSAALRQSAVHARPQARAVAHAQTELA